MSELRLSVFLQERLRCPVTKERLSITGEHLSTRSGIRYPIIDGVPVIINEANSVFDIGDCIAQRDIRQCPETRFQRWIPRISGNLKARFNYAKLVEMLPKKARILVIGGAIMGGGMEPVYSNPAFDIAGLDVIRGPFTSIIADSHDIPFEDETFDCVVIQAVLEYLIDPIRCVAEIHRTLKREGLVYAEAPFMQQVHGGKLDFMRFTHLGLLRLFRHFEEIKSGPCAGPGMALAWGWGYFWRSFVSARGARYAIRLLTRYTAFFLRYFDYYLIDKPGSYDAASVFFFMGKKSETILSDRDLIKRYRGLSGN